MNEKTVAKIKTIEQISAGGAVFRLNNSGIEFAIVSVKPSRRWQLPKGIIDEGETPEQAAIREVREEAGIEAELLDKIETIEYWYFGEYKNERVRFHKLVHFFLMEFVSGDVKDHDHEIAEAGWVSANEAVEMLAFKSERKILEKAVALIQKVKL